MPIEVCLIPARQLIFHSSVPQKNKYDDIDAIRVYRLDKECKTKNIIGSDVFQLAEKYEEEMFEKNKKNDISNNKNLRESNFSPLKTVKPSRIRKIEKV
jgi:hypothetical protein